MSDNDLQRALDEYFRTLDSLRTPGVGQLAELAYLKVLVTKYPGHTRQMLDEIQAQTTEIDARVNGAQPAPRTRRSGAA